MKDGQNLELVSSLNLSYAYCYNTAGKDIGDVNKALLSAKQKWEKVGLGLGIARDHIQRIKADRGSDPGKCMFHIVNLWLRGKSTGTVKGITWRVLIRILNSPEVKESDLAERIMTEKGWYIILLALIDHVLYSQVLNVVQLQCESLVSQLHRKMK